jgi:hypothetical protein
MSAQVQPSRQIVDIPRVESAHVVITLHTTVHNSSITLFSDALLGHIVINPVGEAPHTGIDLSKLDVGADVLADFIFEGRVEVAVVQEDVWVVEPSIEVSLNRFERLEHTFEFLVTGEDDESGVGAWLVSLDDRVLTACDEDLVVLFANFPVEHRSAQARSVGAVEDSYLIAGGAPAGISILPASVGCRTKSSSIKITIKQGKSRTRPRGIEMREFSLRRMRRRKKANLGVIFSALLDRSSYDGSFCAVGSRLRTSCRKFMMCRGSSECYAGAKLY